jgi:urease accessory protein
VSPREPRRETASGILSLARLVLTATATLWPCAAWAHTEGGRAEGLLAGLHHPVSGLDHVLAMVAVGLWGAQLGAPALWLLPVTFPMVMAFGGMLGLLGARLPGVEVAIAVSGIALGLAVLVEWRRRVWAAAALVGFFAVFHGHAHGAELPAGASGLLYSVGFVVATGTLHAVGIGVGVVHRWAWGRVALRAAGAVIAAAGVFFLWRALA